MNVIKTIIHELTAYKPGAVDVSQGDRGSRAVSCRLMETGAPWIIPEGATTRVAYTLPDGTEGLYDRRPDGTPMWEIAGNAVTVELADQLMAQAGMVQMSILIIGPEGGQLATWPIRVNVSTNKAARLTVPEAMPPYGAAFEGKLFYGGPDGAVSPLALGAGLEIRDGVLRLKVAAGGGSGQNVNSWTTEQINLLDQLFNYIPWTASGAGAIADSLIASLRSGNDSGEEEPDEPVIPDEPDVPETTLTSISAVYSGGDVAVGTAVTDLTGIVVTAHYSDGSTETVIGYTLNGTIAEGSNIITVSYGGKTATFNVTGVAESGGDAGEDKTLAMTLHKGEDTNASLFYTGDADSEQLAAWKGWWYKADAIADEDATVNIAFAAGGNNANLFYYAAQIKQEDFKAFYYVEKLGSATTAETVKNYTVRAGHELVFIVSNSSEIASLNVTYTDGAFTAPSELYTNLVEGFTVNAYLKPSDGTVTNPWSGQTTSDMIDVSGVPSVYIWHISQGHIMEQYALTYCFYDESETFISGGKAPANTDAIAAVTVPEDAKYMRVGGKSTDTVGGVYAGVNPAPYRYEFVKFE